MPHCCVAGLPGDTEGAGTAWHAWRMPGYFLPIVLCIVFVHACQSIVVWSGWCAGQDLFVQSTGSHYAAVEVHRAVLTAGVTGHGVHSTALPCWLLSKVASSGSVGGGVAIQLLLQQLVAVCWHNCTDYLHACLVVRHRLGLMASRCQSKAGVCAIALIAGRIKV